MKKREAILHDIIGDLREDVSLEEIIYLFIHSHIPAHDRL